jgi:hypothetical protein
MKEIRYYAAVGLTVLLLIVASEALLVFLISLHRDSSVLVPYNWALAVSASVVALIAWIFRKHPDDPFHRTLGIASIAFFIIPVVAVGKAFLFPLLPYELPYVGVRTVNSQTGMIMRDEVYASDCPEIYELQSSGTAKNNGTGTQTYIERRFFSWRYAALLDRIAADNRCTFSQLDYPSGWLAKIAFCFQAIAENVVASLMYAGLPLLFLGGWVATKERDLKKLVSSLADHPRNALAAFGFFLVTLVVGILS